MLVHLFQHPHHHTRRMGICRISRWRLEHRLRGCTKRPEKAIYIVEFPVAFERISQFKLNENTCHVLMKEPDRRRQLINSIRPQKPFGTASCNGVILACGEVKRNQRESNASFLFGTHLNLQASTFLGDSPKMRRHLQASTKGKSLT